MFCAVSRIQNDTPGVGQRTYLTKSCDYTNEDKVNSPNSLSDKRSISHPQKEKNLSSSGFCCGKIKESEKLDKYLDLAKELKKLWNMNVTLIPIVVGVRGTIS